jgi:predicted ATP-dependent protease
MFMTGYLNWKYGQDRPLSLSASITREQAYRVAGDSASSTQLYALLSELSGLPISQAIAVTGSVNQNGDVQVIGGATHKTEGFFDLCAARGLDGTHGVIVPKDNLKNLVLKEEVVQAVRDGLFHIYGVPTIDEGIEVLTGIPAGQAGEDGHYPEGTVHQLVESRLDRMARMSREWEREKDREDETPDSATT